MTAPGYQLAQLNIARMMAPLTDPVMADFVANLEPINHLAAEAFTFREPYPMPGASPSNSARTRDGFNVTRQGCDVIGRAAGRDTAIGAIFNREI